MKGKEKKYESLRKRIVAQYGTMSAFAQRLGCTPTTLSYKLNGKTPWRLNDINIACALLGIPSNEIAIFFEV